MAAWARLSQATMTIIDADFQITAPLALPEDEVQLWRVDLEAVRPNESHWRKLLSEDESARASRFHFGRDRQSFVASRAILRIILAGYLAAHPTELIFSYSSKEKPSLAPAHAGGGVQFNVSHSGTIAMLAFTRRREIGVDVEQVRRDFELDSIAARFFSGHEQIQLAALPCEKRIDAFFRCWTRKEAYIKATGDGLSLPLSQFDVSLGLEDANALLATRPDGSEASRWLLREVPTKPGYIAAICVRGQNWKLKCA
jgi:4'-phosphopantetheinyl transferase